MGREAALYTKCREYEPGSMVISNKDDRATMALASAIEGMPIPAALFDASFRYITHSPAWIDEFRLQTAEIVGRSHFDVFPEIAGELRRVYEGALEGESIRRRKDKFPRADNSVDYVSWSASPWRHADGSIGGAVVVSVVSTDEVNANERLEERERFIRAMFDQSPLGLNLCRLDGLWLESNQAFLDIIGYSAEEADGGLTYWELTPRKYDEQEALQLESLSTRGFYGPYEKEFIRKDGTLVPVRLNGFFVEQAGQRYIWSLIEDMTKQRALEKQLEQEQLIAIHSAKLATLGEIAAGVAHEINNPLQLIQSYASLLEQDVKEGNFDEVVEAVTEIQAAVGRAAHIVNSLRDFSHARPSNPETLERLRVSEAVEDTLTLCAARMRHHGIEVTTDIGLETIMGHKVEMTQVLLNLLNNAYDALADEAGGHRWVSVVATEDGDQVEIAVANSGIIDPELHDSLFQPFFTTKTKDRGTGLGLSIGRTLIEKSGGTLTLDAQSPHTRFVIRMPNGQRS